VPGARYARAVLAEDLADAPALLDRIAFVQQPMDALQDADALVIVTEWKAYRSPNLRLMKAAMRAPLIFDGRNIYEPQTMQEAGFTYVGIGRGTRLASANDA